MLGLIVSVHSLCISQLSIQSECTPHETSILGLIVGVHSLCIFKLSFQSWCTLYKCPVNQLLAFKVPHRALCTLWWPKLANNSKSRENSINYSKLLQTTITQCFSTCKWSISVEILVRNARFVVKNDPIPGINSKSYLGTPVISWLKSTGIRPEHNAMLFQRIAPFLVHLLWKSSNPH